MAQTTQQTAKQASKEDALQTRPAGVKPRLAPEVKAKREAELLETHIDNLEYRATLICNQLSDMGVSSLAGRIGSYTDVPVAIVAAAIDQVQKRVDACRSALSARSATSVSKKTNLNLRAAAGQPLQ